MVTTRFLALHPAPESDKRIHTITGRIREVICRFMAPGYHTRAAMETSTSIWRHNSELDTLIVRMRRKLFLRHLFLVLLSAGLLYTSARPCPAQPLIRAVRDISLKPFSSIPGMLAVTLVKGDTQSIRFIDLENRRVLEFPSPVSNPGYPSFSPDGESLAFVGTTRRGVEILTSAWHGGDAQRITFNTVEDGSPSWSSDGAEVLYFSENRRYKSEIYSSLTTAPFTQTQYTKVGGGNSTPRASPDGRYLLYSTDRYSPAWNICLIDRSIGRESCPFRDEKVSNCRPNWSPDGSQFAHTFERGQNVDLHVYSLATHTSERITSLPHKEYDATWSPDGAYIAFAHDPKGTLKYDIKVVRLSDKTVIPIARAAGSLRYLSWSTARPYTVAADLCPSDPNKTKPGSCGCGFVDTDTDMDSVPDCLDGCPRNPKKHNSPSCE